MLQEVAGQHRTMLPWWPTAPCAPCAGMLEKLCLAQAQECVFEKARTDKKSPAILARSVQRRAHLCTAVPEANEGDHHELCLPVLAAAQQPCWMPPSLH